MTGIVHSILRSTSAGAEMELISNASITQLGIEEDRYLTGLGHWSDWPDKSGRALTLIEKEILDEIALDPLKARRNVVTVGIELDSLIGEQFQIGEVQCIGVRPCLPCVYLEERVRDNLRAELKGIRGGLRVDILRGGEMSVGDGIRKITFEALSGPMFG